MKRQLSLFAAGLMAAWLSAPVFAQEDTVVKTQTHVVHRGHFDILVQGAPEDDLNLGRYRAFDRFAASHPEIIETLRKQPELIDSDKFLAQHIEFARFIDSHPDIKVDFDANPGNYVPLAPNVEKNIERRSQHLELASPFSTDELESQR